MKFGIVFTTSASNLNRPTWSLELTSLPGSIFFLSPRAEKHFALFGQSLVSLWSWQQESDKRNLILWALLGVYQYYLDMLPDQTRLPLPLQRRGRYERLWERVRLRAENQELKRNSLRNKHEQVQQIQLIVNSWPKKMRLEECFSHWHNTLLRVLAILRFYSFFHC